MHIDGTTLGYISLAICAAAALFVIFKREPRDASEFDDIEHPGLW